MSHGEVFGYAVWKSQFSTHRVGLRIGSEITAASFRRVALSDYCYGHHDFPHAGVHVQAGHDICFERCVFKHLGGLGLELSGGSQDCRVQGCVFTDISGNCLQVGSVNDPMRNDTRARDSRIRVSNCYIHDAPCEYRGGCKSHALRLLCPGRRGSPIPSRPLARAAGERI